MAHEDGTALRYAGEIMREDRNFVLEALSWGSQRDAVVRAPWETLGFSVLL